MRGFLSFIDLSTNIGKGLGAIRDISGGTAALMACGLTAITVGLLPFAWYLDIEATYQYFTPLITRIAPTLPSSMLAILAYIGVFVTVMPTLIELLLPKLATRVQAVGFLVFAFIALDAYTDYPRVKELMLAYRGGFAQWGIVGEALWYAAHIPALLVASILLELYVVLFVVIILALCAKIFAMEGGKR